MKSTSLFLIGRGYSLLYYMIQQTGVITIVRAAPTISTVDVGHDGLSLDIYSKYQLLRRTKTYASAQQRQLILSHLRMPFSTALRKFSLVRSRFFVIRHAGFSMVIRGVGWQVTKVVCMCMYALLEEYSRGHKIRGATGAIYIFRNSC